MKVLHVAESLPGGIATYLREVLVDQCARLGEGAVHVLVGDEHARHLPVVPGLTVHTYRRRGRDPVSVLNLLVATLATCWRVAPDIVHAHSTLAGIAVRLCSWSRWRRPRTVYCAHCWAFQRDVAPWKNRLAALVERLLAWATDGIYSVSQFDHDAAMRFGLPPARCRVIRNGVGPATPAGPPAVAVDPAQVNLFFIGRHDRQKGLDIALDAFRRLPANRLRLYVAGGSVLDDFLAGQAGYPVNVEFLGWIEPERVDSFYRSFDALLIPSRWEGSSLAVLEAMRNGLPVIASNRCSLPEVVQDGVTGRIFDLDHPDSLSELLLSLDRQQLQALGEAGRLRYEQEFTSQRMCREVTGYYQQLLESR